MELTFSNIFTYICTIVGAFTLVVIISIVLSCLYEYVKDKIYWSHRKKCLRCGAYNKNFRRKEYVGSFTPFYCSACGNYLDGKKMTKMKKNN